MKRFAQVISKKILRLFSVSEILYLGAWSTLFIIIWNKMLYFDGQYYWTDATNIWGDWSLHFIYIYNFLYRKFPLHYFPIYWGEPFRYHFIADFITALFMKLGSPLTTAVFIPSIVCSISLVVISYYFMKTIFKNTITASVALILFLFNGGTGLFLYLYDYLMPHVGLPLFQQPSIELTHMINHNIKWINFITAEFIPQRAFLMGFPITIGILSYFWKLLKTKYNNFRSSQLFVLGIITGFMPIIHYHSFFVIILFALYSIVMTVYYHKRIRPWLWFVLPMFLISACIYAIFIQYSPTSLIKFQIAWIAPKDITGYLLFWIKNIGIMAILIPISYLVLPKNIKLFSTPFILLFIISNLFVFQNEPWDNRKFLLYWYFFSAGSVASLLVNMYTYRAKLTTILVILVVYTSVLSGFIDVLSICITHVQQHRLFSVQDLRFADQIRSKTDSESVFLNYPTNSWLGMVLGRQVVMGFDLWLPNYGFSINNRKHDILTILKGSPESDKLLQKYKVDYVIIGPQERDLTYLNEAYFSQRFAVLAKNNKYTIYDVHTSAHTR